MFVFPSPFGYLGFALKNTTIFLGGMGMGWGAFNMIKKCMLRCRCSFFLVHGLNLAAHSVLYLSVFRIRIRIGSGSGLDPANPDSDWSSDPDPGRPKKGKMEDVLCLKSSLLVWRLFLKGFKKTCTVYGGFRSQKCSVIKNLGLDLDSAKCLNTDSDSVSPVCTYEMSTLHVCVNTYIPCVHT